MIYFVVACLLLIGAVNGQICGSQGLWGIEVLWKGTPSEFNVGTTALGLDANAPDIYHLNLNQGDVNQVVTREGCFQKNTLYRFVVFNNRTSTARLSFQNSERQAGGYFALYSNGRGLPLGTYTGARFSYYYFAGDQQNCPGTAPFRFTLDILFDSSPNQIAWQLVNLDLSILVVTYQNTLIQGRTTYTSEFANNTFARDLCLPVGNYRFDIYDSAANGIASPGFFEIALDGNVLRRNSAFGASDITSFTAGTFPATPSPTPPIPSPTRSPIVLPTRAPVPTPRPTSFPTPKPTPLPTPLPTTVPPDQCSPRGLWGMEVLWRRNPQDFNIGTTALGLNANASDIYHLNLNQGDVNQVVTREGCFQKNTLYRFVVFNNSTGARMNLAAEKQSGGYFALFSNGRSLPLGIYTGARFSYYYFAGDQQTCPGIAPFRFTVGILFDSFPSQITWQLVNLDLSILVMTYQNTLIQGTTTYTSEFANLTFFRDLCIPVGNYRFDIFDSAGNGIASPGYYEIAVDGSSLRRNSAFGFSDSRTFLVLPFPVPSGNPTGTLPPVPFPTPRPTPRPTNPPTPSPIVLPTRSPIVLPTFQPVPTPRPTPIPTPRPTLPPTAQPTLFPATLPTLPPSSDRCSPRGLWEMEVLWRGAASDFNVATTALGINANAPEIYHLNLKPADVNTIVRRDGCFERNILYRFVVFNNSTGSARMNHIKARQTGGYFVLFSNNRPLPLKAYTQSMFSEYYFAGDRQTCLGASPFRFTLDILFDSWPGEISWRLVNIDSSIVVMSHETTLKAGASAYTQEFANNTFSRDLCIVAGNYRFDIFDSGNDGIRSPGFYEIAVDGNVLKRNSAFSFYDSKNFLVLPFTVPSVPPGGVFPPSVPTTAASPRPTTVASFPIQEKTVSPALQSSPVSFPEPPTGKPPFTPCFSGSTTVHIMGRGTVELKHVRIGDMVQIGSNQFEPIYSFGHYFPGGFSCDFIEMHTTSASSQIVSKLEISRDHLLFTAQGGVVPASHIKVGDRLLYLGVEGDVYVTVTRIKPTSHVDSGFFAPFTPSGKILVNGGIQASSFISFENKASLRILGIEFSYHWLAHMFEFPHRAICHYLGQCFQERYSEDGVSTWVSVPLAVAQWLSNLDDSSVAKQLILGLILSAFFIFATLEFLVFRHGAVVVAGCVLVCQLIKLNKLTITKS